MSTLPYRSNVAWPQGAEDILRRLTVQDGGSIAGDTQEAVLWLSARGYITAVTGRHWIATDKGVAALPLRSTSAS